MQRYGIKQIISTTLLLLFFLNLFGYGLTSRQVFANEEATATVQLKSDTQEMALEGKQAFDYLKQQGAYESVSQQIRALRRSTETTADQLNSATQQAPAPCLNWREEVQVTGSDADGNDQFGNSVAISGDTLVVGALLDNINGNAHQGAAYVFERNAGGANHWGLTRQLTASDGAPDDFFGVSVAISGNTIVVSAPSHNVGSSTDQGEAYVFERNQGGANNWGEVKKLVAADGISGDRFGDSVAISGDTVVVGMTRAAIAGTSFQGAAYVFDRNLGGVGNWGQSKKLIASDGAQGDNFGGSVAINGDAIVVGASAHDIGGNQNQGEAYIFERNLGGANNWGESKKLTASDGTQDNLFGSSVAIEVNTVVVGAPNQDVGGNQNQGEAYIFERNQGGVGNWGQSKKLLASDGAPQDGFGRSVAVGGDTVIVGANQAAIGASLLQGAAYTFERNLGGASNWGQSKKLIASDGASDDNFGGSVAINGDTTVGGASFHDVGSNADQGAAYVFERNQGGANNWGESKKLIAVGGDLGDNFGFSVAISGDTMVIGVIFDDLGSQLSQGSAYIFERNLGGADHWGQSKQLFASDGQANDLFGISVAINSDTIVVGASADTVGGNGNQGSAYVFERNLGGANNWGESKHLVASDGAQVDQFGVSVDLNGNTIIIGAFTDTVGSNQNQGSAYVYERNLGGTNNWGEVKHLFASDGAQGDTFGIAVAISGDTLVVGANGDNIGSNGDQGSAYVFERNLGGVNNWGEIKHLLASDGAASDKFGNSVAISADTIVIGAKNDGVGGNGNQGSAYVFERNLGGANNWGESKHLVASDGAANDQFGVTVSISGDQIVIGAVTQDVGANSNQGSAYVVARNLGGTNIWGEVVQLTASNGTANGQFGNSVAISGNAIVVGAPSNDVAGVGDAGSAHLFVTDCPPTITAATLNRQTNSSQTEVIAAVNDDRTPVGNLGINVLPAPTGITISNVVNNAGTVTATVAVGCSAALGQNQITVVVEDGDDAASATLVINVTDPPPVITCPPNQTSVTASQAGASVAVNYPAPTASDNCSGVTVTCTPPSGSLFPAGVTTVTCTASDTTGGQASCSFTVTVFNACLQDDSNPANVLLFNITTGDYRFCAAGTTYTGKGTVVKQGGVYTLNHNPADRRVTGKLDTTQNKGNATLQAPVGVLKCSITDRDTRNNSCTCN